MNSFERRVQKWTWLEITVASGFTAGITLLLQPRWMWLTSICTFLLFTLRRHFQGGVCLSRATLRGKTVVVTGSNVGIGRETALDLSRRGATIIMACRDTSKTENVASEIRNTTGGNVLVYELDLASLKSVRGCASKITSDFSEVDILINNAGIMMCPLWKTEDGFEMQFGVNHLGHFLFTNLMLKSIIKAAKLTGEARIVNVSSIAHRKGSIELDDLNWERRPYERMLAYRQSKLANILFSSYLSKKVEKFGITTYSLHPGVVQTELGRHFFSSRILHDILKFFSSFFMKSSRQGAQTSIYCAVDEKLRGESGLYYSDCKVKATGPQGQDAEMARKLWEASEKLVKLADDEKYF